LFAAFRTLGHKPAGKGQDIGTIQEFLSHKVVKATIVYTHVIIRSPHRVRSPVDLV
jgi:site-specific recombinase XerC